MGHTESKIKDTDVQYDITIHTANKKKAGKSDSNTFVILYGDKGVSETHRLRPESRDDFKKGHVDTHPIYEKDLGNLWKVEVWKNDKSDKPGHWFIDYIEVKLKLVPDKRNIKRSFESKREVTLTGNELKADKKDDQTEVSLSKFATPNKNVKVEGKFKLKSSQEETRRVKWTFPCYRWIDEHEELFEGTTVLPQYESQRERTNQRKDETEKKRGIYQWRLDDRLPQYMRCTFETLPFDERWNEEKLHDFMSSRMKAGANFSLDKVFGLFHSWKDFDDYADLFNLLPVPKLQKTWRQDETWARLRLQGVNPCNVQRVTKWPLEKFAVSDEQVKGLLRPGATIASEVKDNRIYLVDFSWLFKYDKPEALKEGRYVGHPQLLLYRNAEEKVLPLCIQLRTTDPYNPKECPIFTPLDTEPEWLLAKMFLANAEALQHQLQAHLLGTHLITEPMVIAMHRQMASCHPIYKLLNPHFKYQIAINVRARELLINPGGPIDDIMPLKMDTLVDIISAGFAEWTFDDATPMAMLKKNNITANPKDLPELYFRDDAPMIWDAIFCYVKEIVDIFYRDDNDIKNDFELQAWADEVVSVGFHGNARGFPRSIESKPELVQCLATIIWTVSAQHAVLNFVQYDCYGWVPAQPGSLGIPPMGHPDSKWERGKLKMEEVFNALPYKGPCAKQIALSYILSQFSAEDQMLGQYPESYFTEDSVTIALENYRKKLAIAASVIEKRNDWDHLHPKKVPNATAV